VTSWSGSFEQSSLDQSCIFKQAMSSSLLLSGTKVVEDSTSCCCTTTTAATKKHRLLRVIFIVVVFFLQRIMTGFCCCPKKGLNLLSRGGLESMISQARAGPISWTLQQLVSVPIVQPLALTPLDVSLMPKQRRGRNTRFPDDV
jgi:hypothetical protein